MRYYKFDLRQLLKVQLLGKEILVPPRWHTTRYATEYILYVVVEGTMKLWHNDTPLTLVSGDVFLFNKGDFHKPIESTYCEYYYVHFFADGISPADMTEEEYGALVHKKMKDRLKANVYSLEVYDYFDVYVCERYNLCHHGLFKYILAELKKHTLNSDSKFPENRLQVSRAVEDILLMLENIAVGERKEKTYQLVTDITEYIENNYAKAFDSKEIENAFFVNYDYANRIFHKVMGCSIFKYRNRVRINEAKVRIRTTDRPLGDIAQAVGFHNIYYFSRLFKAVEGLTPTEYRRNVVGG